MLINYQFQKSVWAVGQGGFSSGVLRGSDGEVVYSYVYDCGSNQLNPLRREIALAKTCCDKISTVFLSHLDADHVNGFDTLCQAFDQRIDEVVLPYLDQVTRYYLVSQAMVDGSASGLFLDFVIEPQAWIRARLPNALITFLGSEENDGGNGEGAGLPPPDRPLEQSSGRQPVIGDSRSASKVGQFFGVQSGTSSSHSQHSWVAYRPSLTVIGESPLQLLAHLPPRNAVQLKAFSKALEDAGFDVLDEARLRNVLQDQKERVKLRDCYLELAVDHNIVSMHLIVKSLVSVWNQVHPSSQFGRRTHRDKNGFGFLFSGDAKLKSSKYFKYWEKSYKDYLSSVTVFSLPHHGSTLSFNHKLLAALPNASFIAQSGENSHEHPGLHVRAAIELAKRAFHQVDEDEEERLTYSFSC